MSEPRKLWMVTAGEYSDYGICAVFEVESDAWAAVKAGLGDDVSEIRCYPAGQQPIKVGYWRVFGTYWSDGRTTGPDAHPDADWTSQVDFQVPRRPRLKEHVSDVRIQLMAECLDKEGAVKAVSDRLAQLKAERLESIARTEADHG